ncbi:MAG: hypothetical protein U0996_02625 [Planctomycetaceae bacterium]
MDINFLIALLSRWTHIGTAIVLTGGLTALRFVVFPVLAGHPELVESIRQRWKKFVHGGIALFLISGFYNYIKAMPLHKGDPLYHAIVGTKILIAFAVFFFASALVGRSAGTKKFRDDAAKWSLVTLLLSAIIIGMSGFVKVRVPSAKPATETAEPAAEVKP